MPITLLDAASDVPSDVSSVTIPLGTSWTPGDLRIIRAERPRGQGGLSCSDGWTQLYASEAQSGGGPSSRWVGIWYRYLQAGDTAPTVAPPSGISNIGWTAITARAVDTTQTLTPSTTGTTDTSSANVTAPSVTTGAGMLLCWFDVTRTDGNADRGSWSAPQGMTAQTSALSRNSQGYNLLLASEARTSGPSGTRTATAASAGTWSATSLFLPEANTAVPKTGSDTATGTETGTTTAAAASSDSGAGTDSGVVAAPATGSDTATGTEGGQVSVPKGGADSATGTETGTTGNGAAGADTATGTSTGTSKATLTSTDTASGAETGAVALTPASPADSGAGTDTGAATATIPGADAATGVDGPAAITAQGTGADTAAGDNRPGSSTAQLASGDTAAATEAGQITIPGTDTATGAEQLTDLYGRPVGGDTATGGDGGYVEALYGDLTISIFAIVDGATIPLPDYASLTLAPARNGPGTLTLTYPTAGLNFATLAATVRADRDLEVEIWTLGTPEGAVRGYLQEAGGDDVKDGRGGVWTFTGGFLELRMSEARVWPQPLVGELTLGETVTVKRSSVTAGQWTRLTTTLGYSASSNDKDPTVSVPRKVLDAVKANAATVPVLADPKREAKFVAQTPGAIIGLLLAQARARGALTDLTTSFTAERDSGGTPWPALVTTTVSPGATYEQVLNLLAQIGRAEWSVSWTGTSRQLNLWIAGARGIDKTLGLRPIVLRAGRNIVEAPRKWSVRSSPTAMGAAGAEGWYADTSDANAQARRGRRIEGWTTSQNLQTSDAVLAYAQRRLSTTSDGTLEVTHGLPLLPGEPRPRISFDVGDWVYSATTTGLDRYRVVEWSLTVDAAREMSATVTLNDAFVDAVTLARQQLDAITAGEVVTGTSTQPVDKTPPSPPTGLLVSSGAFNSGIDAYAVVLVAWTAPETNVDASALTSLAGYRVEWTEYANPTRWRSAATVGGSTTQAQFTTATGLPILVRVAAYKASGAQSTWLTLTAPHTTEVDSTPPPTTSGVVGSNYLGVLTWTWDGKSSDGADMFAAAPNFAYAELHVSPSSQFTQTAATLQDKLYGRGSYSYAKLPDGSTPAYGVTYYARLVPVDLRGNRQPTPSAQGSATPGKLVGDDVFAGAIGTAQLANAAVKNAQIDVAAINSAQIASCDIGTLTAGVLKVSMLVGTGKIATAITGSRVEMDSAGLRLVDRNEAVTVQFLTADGSAMVSGEYRTSLTSGQRLVFNPNGSSPDEIRFYPSSTNQYGRMKTLTSVSTTFPNQAGISMKGYSPRQDGQSGEVSAFPGYARMAYAAEMDRGAVSSSVHVERHQIGIGAPRVTIGAQSSTNEAEDSIVRIGVLNNAGTALVPQATLKIDNSGTGGLLRTLSDNPSGNSGFQFNDNPSGYLGISVVGQNGALLDIYARSFKTSSDRRWKRDIIADALDPIAAVKHAPSYRFRHDDTANGSAPGDKPVIGLMADELPAEVTHAGPRGATVDLYGVLGLLWGATRALITRIEALEGRTP